MRIVISIVGLAVALAAVAFAVANRAPVTLQLWPFPHTYDLPVFILVFLGLGVGFVVGMVFAWYAGLSRRRRDRRALSQHAAEEPPR